ncbi:methionyl-tRNA synthetase [Desulfovibrio ferrophilus]|uniref:Methionine--tRNA ligase n=1 Tax=Desulfovibrio ferrophilus TaxID=241368 RepID=A0A2Z6AV42_9BACT|nr:methionine--tRNA ligase [Desulfovibrio ferrophilus]BBD07065.1 methionyl-tRNA synthetase [Desulfovibrio ferrophilus]
MDRFFITTPIYYVNAKPHLGHAYTTIVADSIARYHRLAGHETFFLTGTDEHGDKIVEAAEKAGSTPQEYVDSISEQFRTLWPEMMISNDDFIRTTEERHKKVVCDILQKVYDAGDIYQSEYEGKYCTGCEQFLTDKDLDENGLCPDHKVAPTVIKEKNYFFRMSKYQDWLKQHIQDNPDFIRPERYRNEVLSMLDMGVLEDLCISRPKSRLTWGIELPFDSEYVTYVWFDALINYITALGGPESENFLKFWPSTNHLVAKDILKPHAIFWPTMLKAAGFETYQNLNVHGYWLVQDTKMSKSIGNVIEPLAMKDKYGLDAFRYFLLREMRFGRDASFSERALVGRLNADLANDLGNLFSRVLSMTHKYFGGEVPEMGHRAHAEDVEILNLAMNSFRNYQQLFPRFQFARALEALWELVRGLNKYVDVTAPWALFKNGDTERLSIVMGTLLGLMRKIALHVWPVMPQTAETMLEQLGEAFTPQAVNLAEEADSFGDFIKPGTKLAKASNLFPRVELEEPEAKPQKEPKAKKEKKAQKTPAPAEPGVAEFADFQKLDLRLGTVLSAEPHPDADRLYVVKIDLAEPEPRQVVAGLREHFEPDFLIGRQVVVVANLAPRKLRGVESQGMIMAVKDKDGMQLLTATGSVENGSKVS